LQIAGPPAPETLRRDQLARRQRIVVAALRALARGEYDDVKVTDIARDSNVALGTLYRYFASKEHLLAAAFVEWQSALKAKLDKFVPHGVTEADRMRDVFRQAIRAFQLQPQFFRVLMMLEDTSDAYATAVFASADSVFHDTIETALGGPLDDKQESIIDTLNAVLNQSLRGWVRNRLTINEVLERVDAAIRLIYGSGQEQNSLAS
jgi:TetR/AcrR family transcriptional regulator, cholesterol catabolism regulator